MTAVVDDEDSDMVSRKVTTEEKAGEHPNEVPRIICSRDGMAGLFQPPLGINRGVIWIECQDAQGMGPRTRRVKVWRPFTARKAETSLNKIQFFIDTAR